MLCYDIVEFGLIYIYTYVCIKIFTYKNKYAERMYKHIQKQ